VFRAKRAASLFQFNWSITISPFIIFKVGEVACAEQAFYEEMRNSEAQ
jgi:hypothetical protein